MSFKLNIPNHLISSTVESLVDEENNYTVSLKVKFNFVPDVESWLINQTETLPGIMISRNDFEPTSYWISLPSNEIKTAFEIAWL